jgi:hypothetical protein
MAFLKILIDVLIKYSKVFTIFIDKCPWEADSHPAS